MYTFKRYAALCGVVAFGAFFGTLFGDYAWQGAFGALAGWTLTE